MAKVTTGTNTTPDTASTDINSLAHFSLVSTMSGSGYSMGAQPEKGASSLANEIYDRGRSINSAIASYPLKVVAGAANYAMGAVAYTIETAPAAIRSWINTAMNAVAMKYTDLLTKNFESTRLDEIRGLTDQISTALKQDRIGVDQAESMLSRMGDIMDRTLNVCSAVQDQVDGVRAKGNRNLDRQKLKSIRQQIESMSENFSGELAELGSEFSLETGAHAADKEANAIRENLNSMIDRHLAGSAGVPDAFVSRIRESIAGQEILTALDDHAAKADGIVTPQERFDIATARRDRLKEIVAGAKDDFEYFAETHQRIAGLEERLKKYPVPELKA